MEENIDLSEEEVQKIMNFIAHCNNFLDGKYLFGNNKIKEINDDIESSRDLTLLKSECLDGFNISLFKTKCLIKLPTKKGTFTSPTEKEDFLALAFVFIEEISNNTVDYDSFISKYFISEKNENKFGSQVIEPLKMLISKLFSLPEDNESEFKIVTPEKIVIKMDNVDAIAIAKNIIAVLSQKNFADEDEKNAVIVLFELIDALENNRHNEILTLAILLKYIAKYMKDTNYLFEELSFCLDKIL